MKERDRISMNHSCYQQIVFEQQTPYLQWLKEYKSEYNCDLPSGEREGSILWLPFFACDKDFITRYQQAKTAEDTIILLTSDAGYVHENIKNIVINYFLVNSQIDLMYADEDYLGTMQELYGVEENHEIKKYCFKETGMYRGEPWFKPEYSPDTLLSFFYFGNVIAFRAKLLEKVQWYGSANVLENIYDAVLQMAEQTKHIGHLPEVLFTNKSLHEKDSLYGMQEELAKIKENALRRRGLEGKISKDKKEHEITQILYTIPENAKVSVIIPSKDNSQVLQRCLDTLTNCTVEVAYDVLVVDNGSNEEQRLAIQKLQEQYHFQYLYEKEMFNFSRMCNRGAKASRGEYLLFLNDDIEMIEENWLSRMLGQAALPWVGAVGAKLYYPYSESEVPIIQHVGITNMRIGPAHKLGGRKDEGNLYHGHNGVTYNMLAVTAACLLVKRDRFEQVNGFDEELEVAYNDVDFCMKLYEAGYYNVIRNDAILLHHESLSRGQDDTAEKKQRLAKEAAYLYRKHKELKGYDPFYSRNLVQDKKDTDYHCQYLYPYDMIGEIEAVKSLPRVYKNKLMRKLSGQSRSMVSIDSVEENATTVSILGWYVLQRYDNALLDKYLLLQNQTQGRTWMVKAKPWLRQDVSRIFKNEEGTLHTDLAGVQVHLNKQDLPRGQYRIGVMAQTQKKLMLCWTDRTIEL